ncbi:MAG: hypothetical protein RLZZ347_372 [Candidatus Parcubacteria bacterium]
MNYIPVIGWFTDFALKSSLAVPFWIIWSWFGIGQKYFTFLPERFQSIPFLDTVGLFMVIPIALHIITPKFAHVSNDKENSQTVGS